MVKMIQCYYLYDFFVHFNAIYQLLVCLSVSFWITSIQ